MAEKDSGTESGYLERQSKDGTRYLRTNRFQLCSRVSQHYITEGVSRLVDSHLSFIRANNSFVLGEHSENVDQTTVEHDLNPREVDSEREELNNSSKSFLNDSVTGSPRHLKKLASNSIFLVETLGKPHGFLTLTTNPEWEEIKSRLFPGQTAYDRPDIVDQVFHARLQALLTNLRGGKYFGGVKTSYLMYVIEYQNRGLPHAHTVFRLENGPSHLDREACKDWIETHICTTAFTPDENSSAEDKRYYEYVKPGGTMQHKCFRGNNGCLNEFGKCKRKYNDNQTTSETTWDERGYPVYKRPEPKDRRVIPHSREVVLDWDGHANLEFAATTFCVFYLYSYIFKGSKKVRLEVTSQDAQDEIQVFLRGRLLTSMDAMWRVLGYHTYPSPYPAVRVVKPKLPKDVSLVLRDKHLCDIFVYFKRPFNLAHLKFTEFFNTYDYKYKLEEARFSRVSGVSDTYYQVEESSLNKKFFIYTRKRPQDVFTRLSWVPPEVGELFYVRQMLYKFPLQSFEDMLLVNGRQCGTFQEAAKERGLITSLNDSVSTFREATLYYPPKGLRALFVTMSVFGYPTQVIFTSPETKNFMLLDFLVADTPQGYLEAEQKLLEDLHDRFSRESKSILDYGLPEPHVIKSVLQRETELIGTTEENEAWLNQLNQESPLTSEMQEAYDVITQAIRSGETGYFLVRGIGGSGKTQFAKKIFAFTRSLGKIVKGCAATALAAQNFHGMDFETAHSLFKCPIVDDPESYDHINMIRCDTTKYPQQTELISAMSVVLWDEIFSSDKLVFNATQLSYDFSGKVLIGFGDEGQIPPVVKYGTRSDIVNSSIVKHRQWGSFRVFKFTKNLRLLASEASTDPTDLEAMAYIGRQKQYAKLCEMVRSGSNFDVNIQCLSEHPTSGETIIRLPLSRFFTDYQSALNYLYPSGFNSPELHKRAILCSTNELVAEWNFKVQSLNPSHPIHLVAKTKPKSHDDPSGELSGMLTEDVCCSYEDNSVPDHILTLKVGDVCLVVRTLSRKDHLANNTRVRILEVREKLVKIETISDLTPRVFLVPRINFTVKSKFGGFEITRTQFPLRLAYAITYNKSQGQTIPTSLIDIRSCPFTHGHLYVAMSRAEDVDQTAFFCFESQVEEGAVTVTNVVYPELLLP